MGCGNEGTTAVSTALIFEVDFSSELFFLFFSTSLCLGRKSLNTAINSTRQCHPVILEHGTHRGDSDTPGFFYVVTQCQGDPQFYFPGSYQSSELLPPKLSIALDDPYPDSFLSQRSQQS